MKTSEKTFTAKKENIKRDWYLIDASNKILGRLASRVAMILMGKNKPIYTAHIDTGDNVVIINAEKIILTGRKLENKFYYSHSGYPGGFKSVNAEKLLKEKPELIIQKAVKRMLPKTKLGKSMARKLKVYKGQSHPHEAQKPQSLNM